MAAMRVAVHGSSGTNAAAALVRVAVSTAAAWKERRDWPIYAAAAAGFSDGLS
jgi:hypothetical protein